MARGSGRGAGARSPQDRTRRAFARRQRARRWLTWRYVLAAVLLVAAVGFGVYALYFSAWLRADAVQVVGNAQLSEKQVLTTADVPLGGPLATVDLHAIEVRLKSLATVKTVDVSRTWPHDVRIEIVERTPVAVLDRGDRLTNLDASGVAFGRLAKAPAGLPRVKVGAGADSDALAEGAAVVVALDSAVAELVDFVEVRTVDEIDLHLRDGRLVRWGSAEQADDKAAVLLELLNREAQVYDVSVPGAPTTR
ncbi:cell division protein FtsQ/DivIB [Nocardioides daeguensis]|uniref:Cell division protein FtsQ n=1 Tax=Nocardioides daeguensis TaxID=908359 RepID=A0ABP6USS8_9ACTN|nr:FtsQ-type POTRA domain-containing protein [Nocardioides daeguensis]MBV6725683.1 FtsQ-type POTRA domain-containing protein [Nocardioides daeguensis]MCR1772802.1 FtsQ-type POTRA domain-containing protein [Nocardioides daeguensis]